MRTVKLIAVGDIFLQTKNSRYPFEGVKEVFRDKDILFGNLETVLLNRGKEVEKAVNLHVSPNRMKYLVDAGFDVLNIANNHIMDLGVEGFNATLDVLNRNNLTFIGGGNQKFNQTWTIIERNDIKFGFLAYYKERLRYYKEGVFINKIDTKGIVSNISNLKPLCDIIIVSLHWGLDNIPYPSTDQINLAHQLIDAGATVILGHHPHVIQGIETYKHGLICYSLGNFQFDPVVSQTKTNKSMILSINFDNNRLKSYDIIPIEIDKNLVPKMSEGNRKAFIDFVNNLSRPIVDGTLTEKWWFEEIAKEYLSGNMKSWIIRIRRYGIRHLLQCIRWLVSPFCIKCYLGMLRRLKEN